MTLNTLADPVARPALLDEDALAAARNAETAFGLHASGCADVDPDDEGELPERWDGQS